MHTVLASDAERPRRSLPRSRAPRRSRCSSATVDEEIEQIFLDLPDDPALEPIAGRGEEVRERLRLLSHVGAAGPRDPPPRRLPPRPGALGRARTGSCSTSRASRRARLTERRRKRSPLRDVAGMLRSFAYAASAVRARARRRARRRAGRSARARSSSPATSTTVDPSLVPPGRGRVDRLLAVFELEKAVYELRYELNNRPDWVRIPVAGIARLLEAARLSAVDELVEGRLADPHSLLGAHPQNGGVVVRAFRPDAERVRVARRGRASRSSSSASHPAGLFEGELEGADAAAALPARGQLPGRERRSRCDDPYAFPPTLGELDLHLAAEGRHERALRAARRARARGRRRRRHRVRRLGARTRGR